MKHALILCLGDKATLLDIYTDKASAEAAHRWQMRGGLKSDDCIIAFPVAERGVFVNIKTGNSVEPGRGGLTKEAFKEKIDSIWSDLDVL